MERPYLIVNAAIGLPGYTWFEREFNLGFVEEEEEFDRVAAEDKVIALLEKEEFECAFVAIMFYEEVWASDSNDENTEGDDDE